jgi:hypothetical protein
MTLDLTQAPVLLLTPLIRHSFEERHVHKAVELIDIHGVKAIIEPFVPDVA